MTPTLTLVVPTDLSAPAEVMLFLKKQYPRVRTVEVETYEQELTDKGAASLDAYLADSARVCIFVNSFVDHEVIMGVQLPEGVPTIAYQQRDDGRYNDIFIDDGSRNCWRWGLVQFLRQRFPGRTFSDVLKNDNVLVLAAGGFTEAALGLLSHFDMSIDDIEGVEVDPHPSDRFIDVLRNPQAYAKGGSPTLLIGKNLDPHQTTRVLRNNPAFLYLLQFDENAHLNDDPSTWKHILVWKGHRFSGNRIPEIIRAWKRQMFQQADEAAA